MKTSKRILFLAALLPALWLLLAAFTDWLGANPVETLSHETGSWSLRFLLLTLAMTPLRKLGWRRAVAYRRMLGLFTFFYASLHVLIWLALDRQLDWGYMLEDIVKRPYITVGFLSFIILLALAATSNVASMTRLGRRWKTLHRLVYASAALGILHYLWLVKADLLQPLIYLAVFSVLMLARWPKLKKGNTNCSDKRKSAGSRRALA